MPYRDTFWNIPGWAITFLYITNFMGIAVLIGKLYMRSHLWASGQGTFPFDHLPQRMGRVIKFAVGQVRIARNLYAGVFHLSIFWAFVMLFIGTTLVAIDEYRLTEFFAGFRLLEGTFYLLFEATLDFFTVAGIVGLALALFRRTTFAKPSLTYDTSFQFVLWILLIDLLSGLAIETFRLAAVQPSWQTWSFAGYTLAQALLLFDPAEPFLRSGHLAAWLVHILITALIYVTFLDLPLKHIIYSPLNTFFSSFKAAGALAPLNLEDETSERFGAGQITDLSILQLLDADACTECGRCTEVCPASMAGTPLDPKQVILDLREHLDRFDPAGKSGLAPAGALVSPEALWACTTCRACVHECPVLIEHVDSIVDMRRYLVLTEGSTPDLLGMAMQRAERAGNPWGHAKDSRMDWAKGLGLPLMSEKKKADVLYWIGCAGAYDPESQKTSRAVVSILRAASIDFAVLGEEERCNCEWARRAGNEYLFQEAAHSNIAVFDKYEFNTLITHCPHCFNTFKNEYPQFGGDYDVVHHSAYIAQLIHNGHLKLTQPVEELITYHDSCYLGRYNGVYNGPRDALNAVEGVRLAEMERTRDKGLCCGGGGAQVWFETPQETPVNHIRLREAITTNATTIGTACPFCTIMLGSAAQSEGVAENLSVRDIAVIVAEALK